MLLSLMLLGLLVFPLNILRIETGAAVLFPIFSAKEIIPRVNHGVGLAVLVSFGFGLLFLAYRYRAHLARLVFGCGYLVVPILFITFPRMASDWLTNPRRSVGFEPASSLPQRDTSKDLRVVWAIFDELDEGLLFPDRPRTLAMPNFDRLRKEAIMVTNAYPPGWDTLNSIPLLLTGLPGRVDALYWDDIELKYDDFASTVRWSDVPNIFGEARALGYKTGLTGWFHVYCHVLGKNLDTCYRHSRPRFDYDHRFFVNIQMMTDRFFVMSRRSVFSHIDDFRRLQEAGRIQAANPDLGLVFVHLPVPHAPWIYDRVSEEIVDPQDDSPVGYIDNLALTDRAMGKLRSAMERTAIWDRSVYIVSADHSWRGRKKLDGRWDPRVPFLIHFPDGGHAELHHPMDTIITSRLISEILHGNITTTKAAESWINHESRQFVPNVEKLRPPAEPEAPRSPLLSRLEVLQ